MKKKKIEDENVCNRKQTNNANGVDEKKKTIRNHEKSS